MKFEGTHSDDEVKPMLRCEVHIGIGDGGQAQQWVVTEGLNEGLAIDA